MENRQAAVLVKQAYEKLKESDADAAYKFLEEALSIDLESEEIKYALKCVHWWLEHLGRLDSIEDNYEKGCFIFTLLKYYSGFLKQFDVLFEQCQYAVKFFIFSKALFFFETLLANPSNRYDPDLLYSAGKCHKGLGNYDDARYYFEQALRFKKEDACLLAEVADINALLAEIKAAKLLFREAFLLDPSRIDIQSLESGMIRQLRDDIAAMNLDADLICEWIPVYGYIWKVLSVKRELKQTEAGKLKQSVFSLETEYEANPDKQDVLKPRLLNRYFWLIDHYDTIHEDPSLISEILLKIKILDPVIYEKYTGKKVKNN